MAVGYLEITVGDAVLVQVVNSLKDLPHNVRGVVFREVALVYDSVKEFSASDPKSKKEKKR